jgi:hypothetical protein
LVEEEAIFDSQFCHEALHPTWPDTSLHQRVLRGSL